MLSVIRRVLIVWGIEIVGLYLLALWLPSVSLSGWRAAVIAVAAIGLLNALLRPILLFLTLPFTVLTFGLLTLFLNALIVIIASRLVPGFGVDGWGGGLTVTIGLTVINTLLTSVLALDDDASFYRNVVERLARVTSDEPVDEGPGVIFIEIDGLSYPALERALASGHLPTLARWLDQGSHRLEEWICDLPTQTSSSQGGILHGTNDDIPAFRWFDREAGRMIVSNHPGDAAEIEARLGDDGLLIGHGASLGNLFSGGAERNLLTLSKLAPRLAGMGRVSTYFYRYLLDPYNLIRLLVLFFWEIAVEQYEALRQRVQDIRPRVSRVGTFPLLRAASTVLLRDLGVYLLIEEMMRGTSIAYMTFVGYDVMAHHAGVERPDSLRTLRAIDAQLDRLERAAEHARREYRFVVLSDHGMSSGATFKQRYGVTLRALVDQLTDAERRVQGALGVSESWGYLNALVTETIQSERLSAAASRRLRESYAPEEGTDVVTCASGNLGLIYLIGSAQRLTLGEIEAQFPGLVEGLTAHEGIAFVMVRSKRHGPMVIGPDGIHYLESGEIEGRDPLECFGPLAAAQLRRLDGFPNVADIVVNSMVDPESGEVAAFEELVGSHGGLGGAQTRAFIAFPSEWPSNDSGPIVGAPALHKQLREWLALAGGGPDGNGTAPSPDDIAANESKHTPATARDGVETHR